MYVMRINIFWATVANSQRLRNNCELWIIDWKKHIFIITYNYYLLLYYYNVDEGTGRGTKWYSPFGRHISLKDFDGKIQNLNFIINKILNKAIISFAFVVMADLRILSVPSNEHQIIHKNQIFKNIEIYVLLCICNYVWRMAYDVWRMTVNEPPTKQICFKNQIEY